MIWLQLLRKSSRRASVKPTTVIVFTFIPIRDLDVARNVYAMRRVWEWVVELDRPY